MDRPPITQQPETVYYVCGDCGKETTRENGGIRCECGFLVLYKKRTRRIVEYQAR